MSQYIEISYKYIHVQSTSTCIKLSVLTPNIKVSVVQSHTIQVFGLYECSPPCKETWSIASSMRLQYADDDREATPTATILA